MSDQDLSDQEPERDSDIPDFIRQKDPSEDDLEHETFTAQEPENVPLALGLGSLVAALGGAAWALVVVMFNIEFGILAWGIGLGVGGAIIAVAKRGDIRLGVSAATIALAGLLLGKVLIAQFGLAHTAADSILEDPKMLSDAAYHDMVEHEEVDPEVVSFYKTATEKSRPGPELNQKLMRAEAKVASRVENMSVEEKQVIAQNYAEAALGEVPFVERMGFSGWDLLWLGVAIYTAFRICSMNRREQVA
jgi:hypothetical protein